ncbi:MAG: hypothetical protein PHF29_07625 [Candidatus Riflebacteria bacterium]|nr:hypothetical protein [Candidatus Riflebacteria bacterium]
MLSCINSSRRFPFFKKVIELLKSIDRAGKILLYPSSCAYQKEFQTLPFDTVILNSNSFPRSYRIGKVLCLKIDNNALIGLFKQLNIEVSDVAIIRDGCCEGGNYECCTGNNFLGKLVGIQNASFNFYFCHWCADCLFVPAINEKIEVPKWVSILRKYSDPMHKQNGIRFSPIKYPRIEYQIGLIKIGVIRNAITGELADYDLVLIPEESYGTLKSFMYFAKGLGLRKYKDMFYATKRDINPQTAFKNFLETAIAQKCKKIAVLPFVDEEYHEIISLIRHHKDSNLDTIDFFNMNQLAYDQICASTKENSD